MPTTKSPKTRSRKSASVAEANACAQYAAAAAQLASNSRHAPSIEAMMRLACSDDCRRIVGQAAGFLKANYNVDVIRDEAA